MSAIEPYDEPPPEDGTLTPPHDLAAEMSILGSLMLMPAMIDEVAEIVVGPDFYRPAHEVIFSAITTAHWDGQPVDAVAVADILGKRGELTKAGGQAYLHQCVQAVSTPANADYHADIVREKAVLRRLIEAGTRVTQLGYGGGDVTGLVDQAQAAVDEIASGRATDLRSAADTVTDVFAEMDAPSRYQSTPWPSLNDAILGLTKGRLYVIGARPGVGKTIVATGLALWWLQKHQEAVAFSTLEMPREEITMRVLSAMSGVDFMDLQKGSLGEFQRKQAEEAGATLRRLPPLWVDDREQVDPAHVRSHARMAARRSKLGLVIVDYLQLMESARGSENRNQEVAKFSRQLKKLARSLDVPVVALSQLNRGSEHRGPDAPPRLSDLRDSGAVEQDADVVVLLHRPDAGSTDLVAAVAKNRQGPKAKVDLTVDGSRMRVVEREFSPSRWGTS